MNEEPAVLCAICQCPIPLGSGRYRTRKGDVQEECYRRRQRKAEPSGQE